MSDFEWLTDEEQGWDSPPDDPRLPVGRRPWRPETGRLLRRHWRPLLIALFLLAAMGALGARALSLRVEAAEAEARDEVLAAHALLLDAAATGDAELFVTLLGGNRSWRQEQLAAFEHHAFVRRDALGLDWQSDAEPMTAVQLSPDLQQALVTATLRYTGYAGEPSVQSVALRHTLRYERDGDRWRLEPHEQAYWDGWSTVESEDLQAVFPGKDEMLGERLAADLRATLASVCDLLDDCPSRFFVQLRFELNSEALHTPSLFINRTRRPNYSLALPAPSLVGLPVDEAGYRVLSNAYQRSVIDQLSGSLITAEGSANGALRSAYRRQLFARLDLIAWPPIAPGETEMSPWGGSDILAVCAESLAQGPALMRYDVSAARWIPEIEGRSIVQLVGIDGVPGVILQEFVGEPSPGAAQTSRLTWWGDGRGLARFEGYFLGDTVPASPALIAGSSDGQNYWIFMGHAGACDGRECEGLVVRAEPTAWSPDGEHTLFRRELEGSRSPPAFDAVLWLGDGEGNALQRLEEGHNPFWIDSRMFGYLVVPPNRQQTFPSTYDLVVGHVDGQGVTLDRPLSLGIMDALEAWAPDDGELQEMGVAISHVFTRPSDPQTLYLVAVRFSALISSRAPTQYTIFLFAADMQSGEVTVRLPGGQQQWTNLPRLSPEGRWLTYVAYDPQAGQGSVSVHDLEATVAQASTFEHVFESTDFAQSAAPDAVPTLDWARSDGSLLILDEGILYVLDPGTWTKRRIIPPTPACSHAAWVD